MDPARFRPVATALSLGLAVLLTGCSGGATAEVLGTPSTTPSSAAISSAPAGPTTYEPATPEHPARNVPKPTLPEKAKENTEEGARAFLQYWAECVNYLVQTGDPGPLDESMATETHDWVNLRNTYMKYYDEGKWSVGKTYFITPTAKSMWNDSEGRSIFETRYRRSGGAVYSKAGLDHKSEKNDANNQLYHAYLLRSDNGWKFVGLQTLPGVDYGK